MSLKTNKPQTNHNNCLIPATTCACLTGDLNKIWLHDGDSSDDLKNSDYDSDFCDSDFCDGDLRDGDNDDTQECW